MKFIKYLFILMVLLIIILNGNLLPQSTQVSKEKKISKKTSKYSSSILLDEVDLIEIIKILEKHTGAVLKIHNPPVKNKKLSVEFHFSDRKTANNFFSQVEKMAAKTTIKKDNKAKKIQKTNTPNKKINKKVKTISKKRISIEYTNIRLTELLERFSELGNVKIQLDNELKKKNIRVNMKLENFSPEEALKMLAELENLTIKKLDDESYYVTQVGKNKEKHQ